MIGVFNRSHYEDVLVVRVKGLVPDAVWQSRYGRINDFERLLTESGTTVVKFFLHISKAEQKRRLEARIADPEKHWKFDPADRWSSGNPGTPTSRPSRTPSAAARRPRRPGW